MRGQFAAIERGLFVRNIQYCFSLYINLPKSSRYTTNEINYLFTDSKIKLLTDEIIKVSDFNTILSDKNYFNCNSWNKITGCYKANGNEQYLTIGIFNTNYKRINLPESKKIKYDELYLLLDDINLEPLNNSVVCKCNTIESEIIEKGVSFDVNKSIILKNILFKPNSDILFTIAELELNKLVKHMISNPKQKIEIHGHTDNSGKEEENIKLSELRSKSVANYLIKNGIAESRITTKGFGSKQPLLPNTNDSNKEKNRRVEIVLKQ